MREMRMGRLGVQFGVGFAPRVSKDAKKAKDAVSCTAGEDGVPFFFFFSCACVVSLQDTK